MSARLAHRAAGNAARPKPPMPKGSGVYKHIDRTGNIEVLRSPDKCWLSMPPAIEAMVKEKTDDDRPTDLRGTTPRPKEKERDTYEPPKGYYFGHYVGGIKPEQRPREESIIPFCQGTSKPPEKTAFELALERFNKDMDHIAEEEKILSRESKAAQESRYFSAPPLPAGVGTEFAAEREVSTKEIGNNVIPITTAKGYKPKRVKEREERQAREEEERRLKRPPANPDPMIQQLQEAIV